MKEFYLCIMIDGEEVAVKEQADRKATAILKAVNNLPDEVQEQITSISIFAERTLKDT